MFRLSMICLMSAAALSSAPAFALSLGPLANSAADHTVVMVLCNPGSPNCAPTDPNRIKIEKGAQKELQNNGEQQDCTGGGICGTAATKGNNSPAVKGAGSSGGTSGSSGHSDKH